MDNEKKKTLAEFSRRALQKLKDVEGFATMFLNYDLLAQRWVRYAYIYPFAEALAGVLMMAGALMWVSIPVALFIGGIGAVSVFKAVYIDRRELKCACVGGDSNVPLGFVSLTENLMMIGMAVWSSWTPTHSMVPSTWVFCRNQPVAPGARTSSRTSTPT